MTHPRHPIVLQPTPLERLDRLSDHLDVEFYLKRDDLAGPSFGGNKARQLEYYFGAALAQQSDTVLITGAVQSNFVRMTAAIANTLGMRTIVQLEDRVDTQSDVYATSGNVLLNKVLGAEIITYPEGEDEAGADRALEQRADELRREGRRPYVIPLGETHPPIGALGYVKAAKEILAQKEDLDVFIVASGGGATHSGLLAGLKGAGFSGRVIGSCVRRDAVQQDARIRRIIRRLTTLDDGAAKVSDDDVRVWDGALAPGYGHIGAPALDAIKLMAGQAGLILDPVYTAKVFAAVPALIEDGTIPLGSKVCMIHTGGLAGVFAYQDVLANLLSDPPR